MATSLQASPTSAAAIRLLILTECRRNETLTLRWTHVDLDAGELPLNDAKTGPRTVQLPPTAVQILQTLTRRIDSPWVFPGRDPITRLSAVDHLWLVVRARTGLEEVRLHDLRHASASRTLALGETLPVIGKLLGHSDIETTARHPIWRETPFARRPVGSPAALQRISCRRINSSGARTR